jgi:hypothetical protein
MYVLKTDYSFQLFSILLPWILPVPVESSAAARDNSAIAIVFLIPIVTELSHLPGKQI